MRKQNKLEEENDRKVYILAIVVGILLISFIFMQESKAEHLIQIIPISGTMCDTPELMRKYAELDIVQPEKFLETAKEISEKAGIKNACMYMGENGFVPIVVMGVQEEFVFKEEIVEILYVRLIYNPITMQYIDQYMYTTKEPTEKKEKEPERVSI